MTSASDIRSPDPSPLPVSHPSKMVPYIRLKPRPPILEHLLFPTPPPDVIFGWPLNVLGKEMNSNSRGYGNLMQRAAQIRIGESGYLWVGRWESAREEKEQKVRYICRAEHRSQLILPHIAQQRAVVVGRGPAEFGRGARDFQRVMDQHIVPRGHDRRHIASFPQHTDDKFQVRPSIVRPPVGEERKVEVAHVVVDGAAAAVPACQSDPGLLQHGHIDFLPRILITADHHARLVPPKEQ